MNSAAHDASDILTAALVTAPAVVTALGWSIGHGAMPPAALGPEKYVCVYDTGGFKPEIRILLDKPTVQVRTRGLAGPSGYDAAYAQALACRDALLGYARATINSTYYLAIDAMSDIAPLGEDDDGRPLWVWNALLWRRPASGTYRV